MRTSPDRMVESVARRVAIYIVTPDELQKRAIKMFGRRWKALLATELKVHLATIYRWLPQGEKPAEFAVPHYVDMWFELQEQRRKMARFAKSLAK